MPAEVRMLRQPEAGYFADPTTFALCLLVLYLDTMVDSRTTLQEVLSWSPETLDMELASEYGVDLPPANFQKLMVAISLLTTNSFFQSPIDFANACVVLSGHVPLPNSMMLPDCADLAWGITEGMLINPPDPQEEEPFSKEVVALVGACLDEEGILNPPDVLKIGLRERDLAGMAHYGFSEDPGLFGAIWDVEQDKTDAINRLVKGRIRALLLQLRSLPVSSGKAAELAERLLAKLPDGEELPLAG